MSLYKKILSQAWKFTWSNKYLWFFGLFAAFLGSGGEYEILFRSMSGESNQSLFPGWQRISETGIFNLHNIAETAQTDPLNFIIVLAVSLLSLVIFAFLIWLSVVSQAAIVNNLGSYLEGKKDDFKSGILKTKDKFFQVFTLNILVKFLIYLVFLIISIPVILTVGKQATMMSSVLYILLFIVFVPIILAISFIGKYAIAYVVIKNNNLTASLKSSWQLFKNNWLVSIEMAFILFLINFFVGLMLILIILTLTIPFFFLAIAVYKVASLTGFYIIVTLGLAIFLVFIVLGGAILSTFQISSWTSLFVQLIGKGGSSKIIRVADEIKEKIVK